jgi:hypothetical protein
MNLTHSARLLFIGLITQADDAGRGCADPRKLRATIFPGDEAVTADGLASLLAELEKQRLVQLYESADHGRLFAIVTWKTHQKIDRPRASIYPAMRADSPSVQRSFVEDSSKAREGSDLKGSDLKGSERISLSETDVLKKLPEQRKQNGMLSLSKDERAKKCAEWLRNDPGTPHATLVRSYHLTLDEVAAIAESIHTTGKNDESSNAAT